MDKMSCAENLPSFRGNIMSFFFQEESVVLANLGGQNFKILSTASDLIMVGPPTSQTIWLPPYRMSCRRSCHTTKLYGRNSVNNSAVYTWNYLQKLNENNLFYQLPQSKLKITIKNLFLNSYNSF